eukprot:2359346-Alexandrium_andersonii.AAC.1
MKHLLLGLAGHLEVPQYAALQRLRLAVARVPESLGEVPVLALDDRLLGAEVLAVLAEAVGDVHSVQQDPARALGVEVGALLSQRAAVQYARRQPVAAVVGEPPDVVLLALVEVT